MYKQVIVLRTDLNMRKGKMAAQASHASMGVFLNSFHNDFKKNLWKQAEEWLSGNHKKVVLGVASEEGLLELAKQARSAGIPHYLVTDAGLTEFNGVPTKTALAIGPWDDAEIDKITGDLKLL